MRLILFCIGALFALVACSPSPSPDARGVRPLTEILARGPEFTELRADSVTVQLDTRIPEIGRAHV